MVRNDRIYLFDPLASFDALGIISFDLNPQGSEFGISHRGEPGRIEMF